MGRRDEQPPLEGLAKTHQSQIVLVVLLLKLFPLLLFGFCSLGFLS